MTAAKSPFARLRAAKPLRIMVLGQGGVGKSALVVRFITRRFIGEYDPTLEKMYTFNPTVDNEVIPLEILDTAGQPHEMECPGLEANIRWADVFILMYSVTDKCSFDECSRLKFLINYNKRRRRLSSSARTEPPVLLVGNKTDQIADRMVSFEDGQKRFADIGCVSFHEISVRENIEEVWDVFRDVVRRWRSLAKCPRLKRSTSEVPSQSSSSPSPNIPSQQEIGGRRWEEAPFRDRASTDGTLHSRPRWRQQAPPSPSGAPLLERRMSISMRGSPIDN
ncbi:ras-related and estrogen-regulated growth inhibitor isoform X2 [Neocloeon triangulifer]|uniref:ras-related and estrogen-regulated growth inhibitor isoform X2 n=1 Tax=Neocloeon triangulifer TaxID=2078957 RepID=UPI00286EF742|nr:ras-related and estrogen-regulated growth inhibitor isoform X2 [Neocloeon triangulifer]